MQLWEMRPYVMLADSLGYVVSVVSPGEISTSWNDVDYLASNCRVKHRKTTEKYVGPAALEAMVDNFEPLPEPEDPRPAIREAVRPAQDACRLGVSKSECMTQLVPTAILHKFERLLKEATNEATKKGFCDEELGKATQERDFRLADAKQLNVELAALEAKEAALEAEIQELTTAILGLEADLASMTAAREREKAANMATIRDAKEGAAAITEAMTILRVFYKQAAKATVMVQASPVDEDTSGPGFDGAYRGQQEASKGIIGMLEVIKTDFERTERITVAAEEEAARAFVRFDRVTRADIGGKQTKKALDEQDLATTKATISQKMSDLQTAVDLLDSALRVIEGLKPTCIDTGMSYAERVARREEEIAALKRALCILDTEGMEPECQP